MKDNDCIFCKIAKGIIPAKTIFEDEHFKVILDLSPATRGHALIIPLEHCKDIYDLEDKLAGEIFLLAKKLAKKMSEKLLCDGFNIVQNNGESAGQTVFHFHMHLIPRYKDDNQRIGWKPKNYTEEEIENIRKAIVE